MASQGPQPGQTLNDMNVARSMAVQDSPAQNVLRNFQQSQNRSERTLPRFDENHPDRGPGSPHDQRRRESDGRARSPTPASGLDPRSRPRSPSTRDEPRLQHSESSQRPSEHHRPSATTGSDDGLGSDEESDGEGNSDAPDAPLILNQHEKAVLKEAKMAYWAKLAAHKDGFFLSPDTVKELTKKAFKEARLDYKRRKPRVRQVAWKDEYRRNINNWASKRRNTLKMAMIDFPAMYYAMSKKPGDVDANALQWVKLMAHPMIVGTQRTTREVFMHPESALGVNRMEVSTFYQHEAIIAAFKAFWLDIPKSIPPQYRYLFRDIPVSLISLLFSAIKFALDFWITGKPPTDKEYKARPFSTAIFGRVNSLFMFELLHVGAEQGPVEQGVRDLRATLKGLLEQHVKGHATATQPSEVSSFGMDLILAMKAGQQVVLQSVPVLDASGNARPPLPAPARQETSSRQHVETSPPASDASGGAGADGSGWLNGGPRSQPAPAYGFVPPVHPNGPAPFAPNGVSPQHTMPTESSCPPYGFDSSGFPTTAEGWEEMSRWTLQNGAPPPAADSFTSTYSHD